MIRQALVTLTLALAAGLGGSSAVAQTPPNTVQLQPAPDILGVIAGGTMPEVVIKGLTSSDDPLWLPNIGLVFSESQANRSQQSCSAPFTQASSHGRRKLTASALRIRPNTSRGRNLRRDQRRG